MTDTSSEAAWCYWGGAFLSVQRRSGRLGRNETIGGEKNRLGRICSQCQRQVNIFGAVPVRTFPLTRSAIFTFHFTALQTLEPVQARGMNPPPSSSAENCQNHLLSNCQSNIRVPTIFLTFAPHPPFFPNIYHRSCRRWNELIYLHCILLQDHLRNLIWPPPHLICDPRRNFLVALTSMGHPNKCAYFGE